MLDMLHIPTGELLISSQASKKESGSDERQHLEVDRWIQAHP